MWPATGHAPRGLAASQSVVRGRANDLTLTTPVPTFNASGSNHDQGELSYLVAVKSDSGRSPIRSGIPENVARNSPPRCIFPWRLALRPFSAQVKVSCHVPGLSTTDTSCGISTITCFGRGSFPGSSLGRLPISRVRYHREPHGLDAETFDVRYV